MKSQTKPKGYISYSKDYNPIREYWEQIQNGEITVSRKVHQTYTKVIYDLDHENEIEWFYSAKRANHIIEFFENYLHHSKGKMGGQRVILELWEKAMLATIFGFIDIEGNRKYQKAGLIVGKKNGKSLLASGVGLYMQCADGESGPEVYAVARVVATLNWAKSVKAKVNTCIKQVNTEVIS